jgi:hypothetical protein
MLSLAMLALACSSKEKTSTGSDDVVLTALTIEPAEVTIATGPEGGLPVDFTVTATLEDGSVVELEEVEWSLSNRSAGELDDQGVFTPSDSNGGITYVTAGFDGLVAQALVTVTYGEELVEEGANAGAFRGAETEVDGMWAYPQDGVNFPRNTPSIKFQWYDQGAESYKLRFRGATTDLSVYTTATSWTASEEVWTRVVSTNAGGSLSVTLSAAVGGAVYSEAPLTLNVNRMDGTGSIYYWSTSASGIMEVPYGGYAREYLTYSTTGRCVGCHDISPQGYIAMSYDGGNGSLVVKRLSDGADMIAADTGYYGNFKTFSPDGRYMATTLAGTLLLYDATTFTLLYEVPVDGSVSHVDWSPDGDSLALVTRPDGYDDWCFYGGSVSVMDHNGDGTFSAPRVIYAPPSGYNAYYPVWSPDGDWIAFNVSYEDAYDDASAMLNVIARDGGTPIVLGSANLSEGYTNSWPRWGPLPDDEVLWLAFSSKRAYGTTTAAGVPQIWVTAFDPERAARGEDPSWPAFWLPGQDPAQSNHIPVWTE